jgi:hypothetical protein
MGLTLRGEINHRASASSAPLRSACCSFRALTKTGGGAATVADRLGTLGVEVVPLSDAVVDNLARRDIKIPRGRLTDLTLAGTKAEVYGAVVDELLASGSEM